MCANVFFILLPRVTNLYNMLPGRSAGQLEVLLLVIRYAKEAKLVAMLASFFAGVDDWIKVSSVKMLLVHLEQALPIAVCLLDGGYCTAVG